MVVVNYMGTNSSGKSTRMTKLMDYLKEKYDVKSYFFNVKGKNTEVGYLFDDRIFIFGKQYADKFLGFDAAIITTHQEYFNLLKQLKSDGVKIAFFEGYFNNHGGQKCDYTKYEEIGCKLIPIISCYDDEDVFYKRLIARKRKFISYDKFKKGKPFKWNERLKKMRKTLKDVIFIHPEDDPEKLIHLFKKYL